VEYFYFVLVFYVDTIPPFWSKYDHKGKKHHKLI